MKMKIRRIKINSIELHFILSKSMIIIEKPNPTRLNYGAICLPIPNRRVGDNFVQDQKAKRNVRRNYFFFLEENYKILLSILNVWLVQFFN